MSKQFLHAPPLRQRIARLTLWFGIAAAVVTAAEFWFFPWLRVWLSVKGEAELLFRLRVVFGGLALGVFAAAAYVFRTAGGCCTRARWPLPGAFVLRDTPVVTGRSVQWRGWAMIVWAALAAVLAVFAALMPELIRPH